MNTILLKLTLIIVLTAYAFTASADTLKPFTSDGCSSFPDGTFKQKNLWLSCCQQHDLAYWQGGTYQERLQSDFALKTCVSNVGEPQIAALMLAGVRVGGTPFYRQNLDGDTVGLILGFTQN